MNTRVKFKNKTTMQPMFFEALKKIGNCPSFNFKTSKKISAMLIELQFALDKAQKERVRICEAHCDKDEAGAPLKDERGGYKFKDPAIVNVEFEAWAEDEFELASDKLIGDHVATSAQLSPNDISALDGLFQ